MNYKLLLFIGFISFILGCSDIFEKDISEEEMFLQAPADNFISYDGNILFWWEYLEGAENYDLQVVSPDFDKIEKLLLDSTVSVNKFQQTFPVGKYQWRVSGINNQSATSWYWRSFSVVDTSSSK